MKKTSKVKKVIISVICIIAAAGACCGAVFAIGNRTADTEDGETNYREYTAVKNDITVGISESGTASVNRSYLSFPVSAEVEEVYVKVGSEVKNGDKIAKLSTEDIDEVKKQYETKLSAAKLELETAVTESKTKLAQAKDTYESNLLESSSAQETYNLSVTKIQSDISDAKKNIETLKRSFRNTKLWRKHTPTITKNIRNMMRPTVNTKILTKALRIHMRDMKKFLRNMRKNLPMLLKIITIISKALKTNTMNW